MSNLQWFRLYHRIIDDEKIRLLAFEDRWHFIAVCCLKADGLLDEPDSDLKWRKIAVKLGVQLRELDEIKRRLFEVGLVDQDMQPAAWNELQYKTDTSTERVRRYREKLKKNKNETQGNVSVTPQETDTDTETETDNSSLRSEGERVVFDDLWEAFPQNPYSKKLEAFTEFNALNETDQHAAFAGARRFAAWFREEAGRRKEPLADRLSYAPSLARWLRNRGWIEAMTLKVKAKPNSEAVKALENIEYVDRVSQPALFEACEKLRGRAAPVSIQRFAFDRAIVERARANERQIA